MNRKVQKILSFVLTLCLLLSNVPVAAFAVEATAAEATTTNGSYVDGEWTEGGTGSITHNIDGTNVTLSKTATPVAGKENTYNITLKVQTSTTTTIHVNSGAVVLVIDVSGSMDYCAECKGESTHEEKCPLNKPYTDMWGRERNSAVTSDDSRMRAAKNAAAQFLQKYAGTDASASRMLAIVAFSTNSATKLDWVNVAGGAGKNGFDSAWNTIYGLDADGGTNLEAGLKNALDLLGSSAVSSITSKNVIALTDGIPTYRIGPGGSGTSGSGSSGSKENNDAAANQATKIKETGATLYTVCFGVADEVTYRNGPTVGAFLSGSVASSGCAYNANNSQELYDAFAVITESITDGLNGSGWTATDPMADMITVTGGTSGSFYNAGGSTYTWELANAEVTQNGNVTTYTYTYTYQITLDVQGQNFEEGKFFPTNEETYLNVNGQHYAFPVPGVTGVLPRTDVSITKVWDDKDNQDGIRTDYVTVQLKEGDKVIGEPVVLSAENNWTYTWDAETYDLIEKSKGQYHVYVAEELGVPEGYEVIYDDSNRFALVVKNTHETKKTDIIVTKVWDDKNDQDGIRPDSITVNLLADGVVVGTAELTAETGWTYTFAGYEFNRAGKVNEAIVYTVEEAVIPEGYTASVDGFTVTNSHTTAKTSVTVNKVWNDANNQDGIRPNEITVKLFANGVDTGKTLTIAGDSWTGSFTGLDKYSQGQEIVYTVEEIAIEGYTASYSEDTLTITNTHVPAVTSVNGSKTWVDNDNQDGFRPEYITISLRANGEVLETITVTEADGWAWSFNNLPKYEAGKLITYSIVETAVDGYSTSYNGYNVTNTHTPEKTSVTVSKTWKDNNNQDGFRPNDITVKLLANGVDTGLTLPLNEGNGWTGAFSGLDVYQNGRKITYTVEEIAVDKYDTAITGSASEGFVITNTHTPETVKVEGAKTWIDADNQDGKRPASITINLKANGEIVDSIEVTAEDGWAWSFTDLPKYEAGKLITYTITETAVEEYITEYDGFNVINTHAPEKTSVTVSKTWKDSDDQDGIRPNDITVILMANGQATGESKTLSDGNSWTAVFSDLDKYLDGEVIEYTVQELEVPGYTTVVSGSQIEGYTITNAHTPATVVVAGSKTWVDADNQDGFRPESITIRLHADGKELDSVTVSASDNWSWSFTNLPKFRDQGVEIIYTITEDAVAEYTSSVNGYNVTNTHAPEKVSVSVNKVWTDSNNQDGIRPESITAVLLADGAETGKTLVLTTNNGWAGTFEDLDKYADGKEIVYTVQEITVAGYNTVITGDMTTGFVITNSHTTATVEVSGTKTWIDAENQDGVRPESITISLLADGVVIDTAEVTAEDNWTWSFTNLHKYRDQGTLIKYSVTEATVEDYSTEYDGYNVTNTHTPAQTSVTVSKAWVDNNDQDGIRPNDITVKLLANGVDTGKTLVLSDGNHWTGSFTALDKFAGGKEIKYSVAEVTVNGYNSVISGNQTTGYTITNSHTPETVAVAGTKTWVDADNQDGFRPESITIHLLKNGKVIDTKVVTEADGWAWNFTELPKYENHGTLIEYAITEDAVDEYSTSYNGNNVTNTHTPEKTSVTVSKAWADVNNQDGIRPNEITVVLVANGVATDKTLVLSDGNHWTGSFTDLDKYADGEVIEYSVQELNVSEYETVITGDQITGYTVTNTHTPYTVSVEGKKTWDDNDNQDGFRPESITIKLLADGEVIDTVTVTEADDWSWSFTNLPKNKNQGVEIVYSIVEVGVENYSTTYNGYNVTNKHTPEQTSVTVTKAWVDNDDQDGIRPNHITVVLLANGAETGKTLVLNDGNNWTGSFTELDKYENGVVIKYTVAEIAVEGYETVVTGNQNDGYTVTNSHNPAVVEVAGTKTWDDNNNQDGFRPESITINLLKDGQILESKTVTAEDNWSWSFTNLPKYENHGTLIVYTITENAVEDYSTTVNGYNVTNAHTPEKISVQVSKAWADSDDQDGIRPNDITVALIADGVDTGKTLVLSQGNNWSDSFTELDKYSEGKEIVYSVKELEIDGYTTVITGDQYTGYTVTNSHTPEVISISGSKTWNDKKNQDGVRPESITINLLANGSIIQTVVVTEAENWQWTFENLPKYENHGSEIVYAITENVVENYSTEYDGYNVINTHAPEQTSVTVTKAWFDNNDQDGIRPDKITVILLANGQETRERLVLTADNNWTGSFTELDKYADGVEIIYTVSEIAVEDYETVITGDQYTGYTITNSHLPEVVAVEGSKTWDDADNQDGVRPESITVNLMANGQLIESVVVTEADNWSWSFTNLPKYENGGHEIVYAVMENAVEGYTTTYDGYNIINSYTPAEISVSVIKSWIDGDDKEGDRPKKITITLYADGELLDQTLVLTADDNWRGSFVGLPKYRNGVEIVYTIGEKMVHGYNTVIRGDMTNGFRIANSHMSIPSTGDERTPILWMFLMLASAAVVAYVEYDSRKRRMAK